jgi:hypothetical protein
MQGDLSGTILPFDAFFPEIAPREARMVTVPPGEPLPADSYVFVEAYCAGPDCDCQRAMLNVMSVSQRAQVATINHALQPPGAGGFSEDGTFLDPLNPQSQYSDQFLALFLDHVLDDEYEERLRRHYRMVKESVRDPSHPAQKVLVEVLARRRSPGATARRSEPRVGRNELCACGSGRKRKRCCG